MRTDLDILQRWVDEAFEDVSGGSEDYQLLKDFALSDLGITVTESDLEDGIHGKQNTYTSKITMLLMRFYQYLVKIL